VLQIRNAELESILSEKIPQVSTNKHAHHVIFGAGLIGCYLGGALTGAKQSVSLIGRKHFLKQLQKQFTISDYTGNRLHVSPLPACFEIEKAADCAAADVIWLTVKCTALDDAIADMRPLVNKNTMIICCQNGVSNHQIVEAAFPHNTVIRAMVPFNVVNDEGGVFHRGSEGKMILEINSELASSIKWLARQLNTALLPVDITYHMTALQWAKLQLNLSNAVNALADIPVKEMLETSIYRKFIATLMEELLDVTDKQKIKLPKIANLPNTWIPKVLRLPDFLFKLLAQKMIAVDPKVKLSMWWDLKQDKLTEVDFINGKVLSQADKLEVAVPANKWIVSLIHRAEKGERPSADEFKEALLEFEREHNA
jgi:2-dehydropantoate 2-reductase